MSTVELSAPRSLDASLLQPTRASIATGDAAWWRFLGRWSLFAAISRTNPAAWRRAASVPTPLCPWSFLGGPELLWGCCTGGVPL